MPNRNESVHERLNRELWRARLLSRNNWLAALATIALFAVLVVFFVRVPGEVTHRQGIMEDVMPLLTETGMMQVLSVRMADGLLLVRTRAAILHPARGEVVCVRQTSDLLTGRQTAALADPSACAAD